MTTATVSAPRQLSRLPWATAMGVFVVVRAIGIAVLALLAARRDVSFGTLFTKWDGQWMVAIAQYGYRDVPATLTDAHGIHTADTGYAFFPGYPLLVGVLADAPGVSVTTAALTLNVLFGLIAAVGVARLGALCADRMTPENDPGRAGLYLVVLFAATPMSVVLNMAYTEALFCALAAWALVFVLERSWLAAGAAALAIGLVRPTGVAVIAVVMVAAVVARRDGPRAWAAVVLAPLGYLGYLGYVAARTGSLDGWFTIQTQGWDTRMDLGAAATEFIADSLTVSQDFAAIATALIMLGVLCLLMWSVAARLPWPVLAYGALVTASILLSSGLMMSRARLLLPAFVLLIPLAVLLSRQRRTTAAAVLAPIVLLSAWFGAYMLTVFQYAI
ncbi:hypothetical protein MYK68_01590 [Gordonia sp. PP30]|uniref:hypothetical protein n=1 Tax=unclassified Gordonia (in: high G+C Gram-positive bacteria) TaxID=2657482 RepID=UPI00200010D7|nr:MULTISPECIES: hypothetical protein [unclassified Gordonia (in: high G+C Gram-positive bacteria)]UQE75352.1 hypothetical protein MYK68_01590 [Gordonia sp. PP30]